MTGKKGPRTIELDVTALTHDGRGVGRLDGKTVFVSGALPSEQVSVRILRRHARFDEGETIAIRRASEQRVQPPCPHFGNCGGCSLQHLEAGAQLLAHQQTLAASLQRIAHLQPRDWLTPVRSAPWGYRARARLAPGRESASGSLRLGFRREDSRHVEPVASCAVLEPALQELIAPLSALLDSLSRPDLVREVLLASDDAGVAIGLDCHAPPSADQRQRLQGFGAARACPVAIRSPGEPWTGEPAPLAYEPEPGLRLGFAPWHFTQANRRVNRELFGRVMELLAPATDDHVLDLFCGIGNFTLGLARRSGEVTGVDAGDAELAQARTNAALNACDNVRFHRADLSGDCSSMPWVRARHGLVLLDPPRAGAARLVPLLDRLAPRRLCYVACDPATFSRDAAALVACGFTLQSAGVLDMFPQTAHFETVALFTR